LRNGLPCGIGLNDNTEPKRMACTINKAKSGETMTRSLFVASGFVLFMMAFINAGCSEAPVPIVTPDKPQENQDIQEVQDTSEMNETAVLAGGCFWGMQDLIRKMPGIISTRVGYTGGDVPDATYGNHGTHAEAIEIVFNPNETSYRKILEFFFQIHDPTTKNRQGNDRGMSYRSAIYFTSDQQKAIALDTIKDVNASGLWPGLVVTEVEPSGPFWEAEDEHQDYLERNPEGYTCHFARPDWVLPKRTKTN